MIDVILQRHVLTSGVQYLLNIQPLPKELKIHTTRREQRHNAAIVDRAHFIG